MANDRSELSEFETQMSTAMETIRAACLECLHQNRTYPHIIVMAAATVTGELGAAAAMASGGDLTGLLNELGDIVRRAGQEQWTVLKDKAGH